MTESNPLAKKLQIRPGTNFLLLNAPASMQDYLSPLPEGATWMQTGGGLPDVVLVFVLNSGELAEWLPRALAHVGPTTILWMAYPKGSSKVPTDLTRDRGWTPLHSAGYEGIAQVAVDATWAATRFRPVKSAGGNERIEAQYAGRKAGLFPIYLRLRDFALNLGPDVTLQPRQTYVAFSRGTQFALAKPGLNKVDLGLKLANSPDDPRVEPAAGIGSGSMTHRIVITSVEQVDETVKKLLAAAYQATPA